MGFVVGEAVRCKLRPYEDATLSGYVRLECKLPGLPGTLHDGALHECVLIFHVENGGYADEADMRNEIYPPEPPTGANATNTRAHGRECAPGVAPTVPSIASGLLPTTHSGPEPPAAHLLHQHWHLPAGRK